MMESPKSQEPYSKQLVLHKRQIRYGKIIATGLRVAGLNLHLEPLSEKDDRLGIREKIGNSNKTKELYAFQVRGAPYAVDAFSRSLAEMERWYERIYQHKNITRAAAAVILAGVAYKLARDAHSRRFPPRYDGRDFEE